MITTFKETSSMTLFLNHELSMRSELLCIHHPPPSRIKTRTKYRRNEKMILKRNQLKEVLSAKSFHLPKVRHNYPFHMSGSIFSKRATSIRETACSTLKHLSTYETHFQNQSCASFFHILQTGLKLVFHC